MWIAIVMRAMVDIDAYSLFKTEEKVDIFGVQNSSPGELDPDDDPDCIIFMLRRRASASTVRDKGEQV